MGQFVGAIVGMAEACRALDFPVVSGNVSLYNETNGRGDPADARRSAASACIDDVDAWRRHRASSRPGDAIVLVGETHGLARPVALSARDPAAARTARRRRSTSRVETPQRRLRARADRAPAGSAPATTCPTAACSWRWPRWRWPAASAPTLDAAPARHARRTRFCSARTRAATCWRSPTADAADVLDGGHGRRRAGACGSATPAATR